MNAKERILAAVTLFLIISLTSCAPHVLNVSRVSASENTFHFRNDFQEPAYDLEVKFDQSVDIVTKGPFKDVDSLDEGETHYRFRDGVVLPGKEIEIIVRAKKPGKGKILIKSWTWSFTKEED